LEIVPQRHDTVWRKLNFRPMEALTFAELMKKQLKEMGEPGEDKGLVDQIKGNDFENVAEHVEKTVDIHIEGKGKF